MKQDKITIKGYFNTGDQPTQEQYHNTWDSFWHKDEEILSDNLGNHIATQDLDLSNNDITNVREITAEVLRTQEVTTNAEAYGSNWDADLSVPTKKDIYDKIEDLDSKKIKSDTVGEPAGSDQVFNIVSLTQAEYDAGTPVATTLYNITDA